MPYQAPTQIHQALDILRSSQSSIIAGCTDYFPSRQPGILSENVLDITRIPELSGITETADGWRIGATTTWTEIIRAPLPPAFEALKSAAREVGSVQIQNKGTVAGNICNASPAADGVPPLIALDAVVEVQSGRGVRSELLSSFITGVRATNLADDEMVTAILIPAVAKTETSAFLKLGSRTHLVISIAMVAANVTVAGGKIAQARIAVGSCSPVAQRLANLEQRLGGTDVNAIPGFDFAADGALSVLSPIDDVRGSAEYRLDAVAELCRRAVLQAVAGGV